jgi:hypothetical protein
MWIKDAAPTTGKPKMKRRTKRQRKLGSDVSSESALLLPGEDEEVNN